jgi:hypothetical protein
MVMKKYRVVLEVTIDADNDRTDCDNVIYPILRGALEDMQRRVDIENIENVELSRVLKSVSIIHTEES